MKVRAVWRFLDAESGDNTIRLYQAGADTPLHCFSFPRQQREDGLCLSDYILPSLNGTRDSVALFVVTAG